MRVGVRLLLALLFLTTACFGAGRIKGRVYDKQTNEPLVGANAFILKTSHGLVTWSTGDDASPPKWDDFIPPTKNFSIAHQGG